MSLVHVAADPAALDHVDDPAAVMVALVDQARVLLTQAQGMEGLAQVVELKSRAEAIRVYTQQKDMGRDAELAAAEIVRRAERRIGELIREGQAAGEIATRGDETSGHRRRLLEARGAEFKKSPTEAAGVGHSSALTPLYELTDGITSEQFEEALSEAKEEGNLSRANVARKAQAKRGGDVMDRLREAAEKHPVKRSRHAMTVDIRQLAERGHNSRQIAAELGVSDERIRLIAREEGIKLADNVIGKVRQLDPNRVMSETVHALDGIAFSLRLIESQCDQLELAELDGWLASIGESLKSITRFHRQLKGMIQ